ncbi:NAD(P)-dependent oxidoreductase [Opitutaceae bacterium EW11]|nr:NAD(P)-dependent oxidoreductase [Opitutaceae bacterium EW11]
MKTVGVLGLGIIGRVWAGHYAEAGVLAGAWNRSPKPDCPKWQNSPEAVARAADVIQIVVADPPAVESILKAIAAELNPSKIVVQSSTIDPESSERFRLLVKERGARYLEAPFTGSKPAAEQKQTVFYLGGEASLIQELEPVLSIISATRFHIGTNKQATSLKLAMNLNIAGLMESLSEALTIARRAGVADEMFFDVLAKNVGYSGLVKLKEAKLRTNDFSPQFSVKHLLKDLRLASRMNGCEDFPALDTLRERLAHADRAGYGDQDFSVIIKLLEDGD